MDPKSTGAGSSPTSASSVVGSTATSTANPKLQMLPPSIDLSHGPIDEEEEPQVKQKPPTVNNLPIGPDISLKAPPGVNRVFRADIWDHFTAYWARHKFYEKNAETQKVEEVITWKMRAKCKYCPVKLGDYACDSGPNGTSGLRKHIYNKVGCKYYPGNMNKNQKVFTQGDFKQLTTRGFNQKDIMEACVEMVVLDELPFSFVEKKGFRQFCSKGIPLFKVPSRRTLVRAFLDMYEAKRMQLKADLRSHRVCLTTDTWTSVKNYNYMVLTAHFIDNDWKMHKRVLNFCVITNHQGITIADLLEQCLNEWGIDKVFTITMDNASANGVALELLRDRLNDCEYSMSVLGGKHMHVRCIAYITNLIVGSGLKKLNSSILAIRNAVKFVRSSPQRLDLFKKAVSREKLPYKGLVCLDIPTRWNSTFLMLESALRLKRAFKRMKHDPSGCYLSYFNEAEEEYDEEGNAIVVRRGKQKVGPPKDDDWQACELFVDFLKIFYEVTIRVSASLHPTVHTTLHDIIAIEQGMDRLLLFDQVSEGEGEGQGTGVTNGLMASIGADMKRKYNKYFSDFKNLNPYIILGLVLDPRFKLRHVTHVLRTVMGWSTSEVDDKKSEIHNMMLAMYDEYSTKFGGDKVLSRNNRDYNTTKSEKRQKRQQNPSSSINVFVVDWTKHVEQTDEAVVTHEVDRYLNDPLESIKKDKSLAEEAVEEEYRAFDILQWWRVSSVNYPVLGLIAKDVFAIQMSTVASDSAFSTGGRVVDAFRSSLTPTSVQALICMQNWLKGDDIITQFEDEPCVEELEFYEAIETELENEMKGNATTPSSQPQPSQSTE